MVHSVQTRLSGGHADGSAFPDPPLVLQLREENRVLHETVAIADKRLTECQRQMEEMKDTFLEDSANMKQELDRLQETVETERRQKHDLSRSNERLLRAKEVRSSSHGGLTLSGATTTTGWMPLFFQTLERYLNTLPPQEDHHRLQRDLTLKEAAYDRLKDTLSERDRLLDVMKASSRKEREDHARLKDEVRSWKQKLLEAESVNQAHADRLAKARTSEGADVEVVLEERDVAQQENKQLKQYILFQQQRHQRHAEEGSKTLSACQSQVDDLRKALTRQTEAWSVEKDTNRLLREQVTEKVAQLALASKTVAMYEQELSQSKSSWQVHEDAEKLNARLFKKLSTCVADLHALSRVSSQVVGGSPPDMSLLLGVTPSEDSLAPVPCPSGEEKLKALQTLYESLQETQDTLSRLRQMLTDRCAESIADSMTEHCYVQ